MRPTLIAILPIILLCSACSIYHVTSEETTMDYYPSKQRASDVVYVQQVEKPYQLIGTVTINTERREPLSEVIERMKREAAIIGADAITDIKTDASGTWKRLPAQEVIGNAYVRANYSASAIVFK